MWLSIIIYFVNIIGQGSTGKSRLLSWKHSWNWSQVMYDRTIVAEGYNKYIMIMKWSSDTHSINHFYR